MVPCGAGCDHGRAGGLRLLHGHGGPRCAGSVPLVPIKCRRAVSVDTQSESDYLHHHHQQQEQPSSVHHFAADEALGTAMAELHCDCNGTANGGVVSQTPLTVAMINQHQSRDFNVCDGDVIVSLETNLT